MTKHCGRCGEVKPVTEFHRDSRDDGYQRYCKQCRKAYDADYYRRTSDRRREARPAIRRAFVAWYASLKEGQPCADCGASYQAAVMQWDHLPGYEKFADVGTLARSLRRRRVLEEIAKCELVCANCHAARTVARRVSGRGAAW